VARRGIRKSNLRLLAFDGYEHSDPRIGRISDMKERTVQEIAAFPFKRKFCVGKAPNYAQKGAFTTYPFSVQPWRY